jgi:hydroxymethylpyrimidine pyrophosphatase-like HAD family hydrolase
MPHAPFRTAHPRFDAIICDIDGCLTPESASPLDVSSLARIAEHNRLACRRLDRPVLTLCTGRPQPFAEAMTRLLGNVTLPLVAENGVWLYDPSRNVYAMDPAITREHRGAVRAAAAWLEETFGPRGVSQQPGKAASVSLYHPDPAYLREICPSIAERFEAEGWPMRVSMTWLYINCDLAHVSKSTGLDRLVAHTGLKRERLAGIGDTLSDLAIREHVGVFACPANADERLKASADMVAGGTEAAGVVEILERLGAGPT